MKIAVYGRTFDEQHISYLENLLKRLNQTKYQIIIHKEFYNEWLKPKINFSETPTLFSSHEELLDDVKFLFSIGGDGTFLRTCSLVRDSNIPIIGINTGRLGFLSSISIEEIDDAIDCILKEKYSISKRSLLKLDAPNNPFGEDNFALNEITVHKKDSAAMIIIHTYLDGKFLNTYWADGLIISTPTGSTAYSLSCGGPIVMPRSENFIISPVAPHNLNVRPLVIPDTSTITLKLEGRSDEFLVSLDSRFETVDESIQLDISKNDFSINLLRLESHNYLRTIRNKLNWGLDKRN